MKVIVQLRSSPAAGAAAAKATAAGAVMANLQSLSNSLLFDPAYPPVQLPGVQATTGAALSSLAQPLTFTMDAASSTYLVRGSIPDGGSQAAAYQAAMAHPDVVGVYADPVIESCITCGGSNAVGTAATVASLLSKTKLAAKKLDGTGVFLAIVDTGINLPYLKTLGISAKLDVARSWVPAGVATTPGAHPVNHGTMCAFDALIAAPKATLIDYAVLLSQTPGTNQMAGLLSDAVQAYAKLRTVLGAMPAAKKAMVVSNSWGMFSPGSDFPVGHPGNYSDNPNHPFNLMVATLEADGADILFAAGNCGRDCPDGRCQFNNLPSICGANSHPSVLSIGGVDTKKLRVGYSSQGPGRLTKRKPDVACYTHFTGSGVFKPAPDSGTSAACPVAAGVVVAVRTKYQTAKISPLQLRTLVQKTAEDKSTVGFDNDYGWGILNVSDLLAALP